MKYYILEKKDAGFFETDWEWSAGSREYIAQDAASDFYQNRDGWESDWPVELVILSDEGEELGRFEVDLELEPTFSAVEIC